MNEHDNALVQSIAVGNLSGVRDAIEKGADLNTRHQADATALHFAASKPAIMRVLLDHGADPNPPDRYGRTPLHHALASPEVSRSDRHNCLQHLLDAGANPNVSDFRGTTPLHDAAAIPRETATPIGQLLRAGAHPQALDETGNTPLHYAAAHPAQYRAEAVRDLLAAGCDPNLKNQAGDTPLHMAVMGPGEDQPGALSYLLRNQADLSNVNARSQTPLQLAAEKNNPVARATIHREAKALAKLTQKEPPMKPPPNFAVGTRVRAAITFSGVPKGTEGVIDEHYKSGVMVAWDLSDRPLPAGYTVYTPKAGAAGILRDGFDTKRELRFLEITDRQRDTRDVRPSNYQAVPSKYYKGAYTIEHAGAPDQPVHPFARGMFSAKEAESAIRKALAAEAIGHYPPDHVRAVRGRVIEVESKLHARPAARVTYEPLPSPSAPTPKEEHNMAKQQTQSAPKPGGGKANEYYKEFADRIIKQMEKGTAPWQKSWKPGEVAVPRSLSTDRDYRGGNSLHLMAVAEQKGYSDPRWGTFDHIKYAGGAVRKGEKGTRVVWWDFSQTKRTVAVTDREGKPVMATDGKPMERFQAPTSKVYTVFNVEQASGLKDRLPSLGQDKPGWDPHRTNDDLIKKSGVKVRHLSGDKAYYNLRADAVTLPKRSQFADAASYYQTANHELAHATGHPSRLNRDTLQEGVSKGFGSEPYAREELRAEIASMMTNTRLGLGHQSREGTAYVASWSEALKKNPREIYYASRDAQKISEHLIEPVRERLQAKQHTQEQTKSPHQPAKPVQSPAPQTTKDKTPHKQPVTAKEKTPRSKPATPAKPKTRRTKSTVPAKAPTPKANGNRLADRMTNYRDTIPKDHVEIKAQRPSGLPGGNVSYKHNGHGIPADLPGLTQKEFGAKHIIAHAPQSTVQEHVRGLTQGQPDRKATQAVPTR